MLTIRDREELARLRKALAALNNSTVTYPLTIYRSTKQIAVFQGADNTLHVCGYTQDGRAKLSLRDTSKKDRVAWERREKAFEDSS